MLDSFSQIIVTWISFRIQIIALSIIDKWVIRYTYVIIRNVIRFYLIIMVFKLSVLYLLYLINITYSHILISVVIIVLRLDSKWVL